MGKVPSSTLVDFAVEVPKPTVCEKMELREGTPVYCFTRVRNVDGEPLILETSYYPQYIYPNLTRDMLQTHSFYSLLYHVGIVPSAADESYEAVILMTAVPPCWVCPPAAVPFSTSGSPVRRMAVSTSIPAATYAATGSAWTYICRKAA